MITVVFCKKHITKGGKKHKFFLFMHKSFFQFAHRACVYVCVYVCAHSIDILLYVGSNNHRLAHELVQICLLYTSDAADE